MVTSTPLALVVSDPLRTRSTSFRSRPALPTCRRESKLLLPRCSATIRRSLLELRVRPPLGRLRRIRRTSSRLRCGGRRRSKFTGPDNRSNRSTDPLPRSSLVRHRLRALGTAGKVEVRRPGTDIRRSKVPQVAGRRRRRSKVNKAIGSSRSLRVAKVKDKVNSKGSTRTDRGSGRRTLPARRSRPALTWAPVPRHPRRRRRRHRRIARHGVRRARAPALLRAGGRVSSSSSRSKSPCSTRSRTRRRTRRRSPNRSRTLLVMAPGSSPVSTSYSEQLPSWSSYAETDSALGQVSTLARADTRRKRRISSSRFRTRP